MKAFKKLFLISLFLVSFGSQAQASVQSNLLDLTQVPSYLSEFGFFQDMQNQVPAEGVHPYSLVNPLFSDQTDKLRFVFVPEKSGLTSEKG